MILEKIIKIKNIYEEDIQFKVSLLINPKLLSPSTTIKLRNISKILYWLSLSVSIISLIFLKINYNISMTLVIISVILLYMPNMIVWIWRKIIGWNLDREIPAILAYILPYASGPKYLSDVLLHAPKRYFPWLGREAERLEYLQKLGLDPLTSLKELARTTPSRKLREVLYDYIHSYEIGSPKSQVTLRLLERGLAEVRSQWRSYIEASKAVIEAIVAISLSLIILAPISYLAGSDLTLVALMPAFLSPLSAVVLLSMRPLLGEAEASYTIPIVALIAAFTTTGLYLLYDWRIPLIIISIFTIIIEILSLRALRLEEEAISYLRELTTSARFGRFIYDDLKKAALAASKTIGALIEALKYAGKIGVAEALSNIYRVIEEAREARMSARGQGIVLTSIAVVTSPLAAYMTFTLNKIMNNNNLVNPSTTSTSLIHYIIGVSPLVPLVATTLWRGRKISLIPSLLSFIISLLVIFIVG